LQSNGPNPPKKGPITPSLVRDRRHKPSAESLNYLQRLSGP
jgi:hypothetical protein